MGAICEAMPGWYNENYIFWEDVLRSSWLYVVFFLITSNFLEILNNLKHPRDKKLTLPALRQLLAESLLIQFANKLNFCCGCKTLCLRSLNLSSVCGFTCKINVQCEEEVFFVTLASPWHVTRGYWHEMDYQEPGTWSQKRNSNEYVQKWGPRNIDNVL